MFYYANELFDNGLYSRSKDQYILFLKEKDIWIEDKKTAAFNLAECYNKIDQQDKRLNTLLDSLSYDIPRADICCKIGEIFLEQKKYDSAIFWYKNALNCIPADENMGLKNNSFYSWIPAIQLSVCYCAIDDYLSAYYFNELAILFNGDNKKTQHNRLFISNKLKTLNIAIPKTQTSISLKQFKY